MKMGRVLILYKRSMYEHYHDGPSGDWPDAAEVKRFRQTHEEHYGTLDQVELFLRENQVPYDKVERGQLFDYQCYHCVITVGGDGTFLEAARQVRDQVMLGVNSDPQWSVGRLCTVTKKNFGAAMIQLIQGNYQIQPIARLKISSARTRREIHFVNDVLICHINPATLSRYRVRIGDVEEEHRSSGMWVSTAAGSTGAIHSAGGVALDPASRDFQYMPRELYQGWPGGQYQLRGGILSQDKHIDLVSLMSDGIVFIDGSHESIPFSILEKILITPSEFPLKVVIPK